MHDSFGGMVDEEKKRNVIAILRSRATYASVAKVQGYNGVEFSAGVSKDG